MNHAKCDALDNINFSIAAQRVCSATEAARCDPCPEEARPAHDACTCLLHRHPPDSQGLWVEVEDRVDRQRGLLVVDDSTLDKPYSRTMELVTRHWSGKHQRVVAGINLISLVWTDGQACLPCDFRLYDKAHDQLDKNDHFQHRLFTAAERGFCPRRVVFDA